MKEKKVKTVVFVLRSLLSSFIVTGICLLLLALVMLKTPASDGFAQAGIILSYAIASFMGGLVQAKFVKEKRIIWGAGMGALYFISMFGMSLLQQSGGGEFLNKEILLTVLICIGCGAIGGILS